MEREQTKRRFLPDWIHAFYEKHRKKFSLAKFLAVFVLGIVVALLLFRNGGEGSAAPDVKVTPTANQAEGPRMWTCSMHPQIRQPNPGKCPICGMDLIPVTKTSGGLRTLAITPAARALMQIETAPAERRYVENTIRMVGKVDYDETKLGYITAWVPGRLDRLYVDYTGVEVKKGDHMVYIYSEELYSAQEELIQALKYRRERPSSTRTAIQPINLVESAREKLRLLGLNEDQIKEIEQKKKPSDHLTIYSPVSGVVIEKLKQEGERVALGDRIYTIADLSQVWVHLDAYESDLPWIRYGQEAVITTEAYPGEEFHGRIAFIQPVLNDKTRTVKVRVNVPNELGKLKPEMFVHAVVRPKVASGGRVMDPSLAGKWISPMHPEIVKDEPGTCDICGMPLVRAESLGYVTSATDQQKPPLVIPHGAALVTGTRAIVYVELPPMHSAAEPAFQTLSVVVQEGKLEKIHKAFETYANLLDRPYDQPGTDYAKQLWNDAADQLAKNALEGQRAKTLDEAEQAFARIEETMERVREEFAQPGKPTFEGREIVLGPRAGDYYIVRHGLQEGELVVTQGNFKIDAEIQIQAKPSMMTPEGGAGGGGHHHGGSATKQSGADEHAGHRMTLPSEFKAGIRDLEAAYKQLTEAARKEDLGTTTAAFANFADVLETVDGSLLTGHARMQWKEFSMLLSNDAFEGSHAEELAETDRVYLVLKSHMRRMRGQLGVSTDEQRQIERIVVAPEFQRDLAAVWERYLAIQQALAGDGFQDARDLLGALESAVATVDDKPLDTHARQVWHRERTNLGKLIDSLRDAKDIKAMRAEFKPLSEEIGVLAKAFGFGEAGPIYELHCPMAFQGKGAVWYQSDRETKNPYFGSTMLKCADRVDELRVESPESRVEKPMHEH